MPEARRAAVELIQQHCRLSERRACRLVQIPRSTVQYEPRPDWNVKIRVRLLELAAERPRFGSPRLHELLLREGMRVNHKRTERLYKLENLSLRTKKRKRRRSGMRLVLPQSTRSNERWSMDFVSDALAYGRRFRALTIVDDFTRESVCIEVAHSIPGERVTRVLDTLALTRGLPESITVDNGSEFTSKALDAWAYQHNVKINFIQPGKPVQNAYIESFNGRFRDECLNQHYFFTIHDARLKIKAWRKDYNEQRPHSSLNYLTPKEFALKTEKELLSA